MDQETRRLPKAVQDLLNTELAEAIENYTYPSKPQMRAALQRVREVMREMGGLYEGP